MSSLVTWKQPKRVVDLEFKQFRPEMKRFVFLWVKWWLIIGPLFLYLIYRIDPASLWRIARALPVVVAVFPVYIGIGAFFSCRSPYIYELTEGGLIRRGSSRARMYGWRSIEWFKLVDHPDVSGVRALRFKINRFKDPVMWAYEPAEVDEPALRHILDEHLPGKCWDNVSEI